MMRKPLSILLLGMTIVAGWSAAAPAQGLIVPEEIVPVPIPRPHPLPPPLGPIAVKKLTVAGEIVDAVAVTQIDQVFFNSGPRPIEGTYVFPLEDDISVSKFSMFMDGKEVSGRVLDRDEARRVYESIVRQTRDPALLEYLGTRMYQARIFPIPPGGEARIKLEYSQTLSIDDGLVRYRFPMSTAKHAAGPIDSVALVIHVNSRVPIKSVFCPTHDAAVVRSSDSRASASFEAARMTPDRDFVLYYSLSEKEFGFSLLTYRDPGPDGFFLARIAPKVETDPDRVLAKDICFVVDVSGSMAGAKLAQAQRALRFCLANLNRNDRFNLIAFSHEPWMFQKGLVPANEEMKAEAIQAVERLQANGGTNINDSLLAALKTESTVSEEQPYIVVLLTDGQPTVGVTEPQTILNNVRGARASSVRLFVFGVGTDVNTKLLDRLAEENRGARDYVSDTEDIEVKVSGFYRKVANPVLSNLRVSWGNLSVHDVFPQTLPDVFSGSEVVLVGRYSGSGHHAVELIGSRYGQEHHFVYEPDFSSVSTQHDFVPRLWAVRKIAFLQDQIRLHGENAELKQAIIQLAKEYGIITDYTAYLVLEEGRMVTQSGGRRHVMVDQIQTLNGLKERAAAAPAAEAADAGLDANRVSLRNAKMADDLRGAYVIDFDAAPSGERPSATPSIRRVGNRTFYAVDDRWIEHVYQPGEETIKVKAHSDEYFELARRSRDVAKILALGPRVVFLLDGRAYEVVPASQP